MLLLFLRSNHCVRPHFSHVLTTPIHPTPNSEALSSLLYTRSKIARLPRGLVFILEFWVRGTHTLTAFFANSQESGRATISWDSDRDSACGARIRGRSQCDQQTTCRQGAARSVWKTRYVSLEFSNPTNPDVNPALCACFETIITLTPNKSAHGLNCVHCWRNRRYQGVRRLLL